MKDRINNFFFKTFYWCGNYNGQNRWCGTFEENALWSALGFVTGAALTIWMVGLSENTIDILKVIAGMILAVSAGIAVQQFKFNREQAERANEWNKKDAANKALYAAKENINKFIDSLPADFNLRQMMRNGQIASIKDIHNAMGVFIKSDQYSGSNRVYNFVYHSATPQAHDIQHIHDKEVEGYCMEFNTKVDGRKIERSILSILGEYEYICMSCTQDIFDKEAVIELIGPNIVTTFNTLSDYIVHLRQDGRHGGGRSYVYDYFEKFSKEIVEYKGNKFRLSMFEIVENRERHLVPFRLTHS